MIDEFSHIIFELNEKARDLLEGGEKLEAELSAAVPDAERRRRIQELMNGLCKGMTSIIEMLQSPSSPLDRFLRHTRGIAISPTVARAMDEFVTSHEQQLRSIGISEDFIAKVSELLRDESTGKDDATVQLDENGLVSNLRTLQELICKIAGVIDQLAELWDPTLLKACVKGVIGAATVVVDITGLFTVPDVTGWVLFKSIKSTFLGGRMVVKAINAINEGWQSFLTRRKQSKLADQAHKNPKPTLKKRPS
jgi:hypothetical protein